MRSQKQKRDTRLTGLPTLPMPPRRRRRRNPEGSPLVACGRRAVGAEKSRYQQHVESYNPRSALLRPGLVDLGLSDEITNPEVKSAANGLADSAQSLLDATKAADDQPTAAQRSKILTATSQYLESMNKLDSVCTGK